METKKKDPFKNLKLIAYERVIGPANGNFNFSKFISYAKGYLATETNTLSKDPIWDQYTDEELLIEYFSHLFVKDKEQRERFEQEANIQDSAYDDFLKFANKGIEQNQSELAKLEDEMEENISFSPETLGGD